MRPTPILSRLATGAALLAVIAVVIATRGYWVSIVFPGAKPATAEAAHGGEAMTGHEGHDHSAQGDRIKLSPQAQANLKLEVDALVPEPYTRKLMIPGVVVDRPGETDRGVAARVAGIVTEIKARPGDAVKAGDPLFTLQLVGEFVQGTQTELAKAARELAFAEGLRSRTAEFVSSGTKARSELIEAENQVKRVTTQVQSFRRQLNALGFAAAQVEQAERGEVITELSVAAPAPPADPKAAPAPAGSAAAATNPAVYEVQELKVNLGEAVTAGQTMMMLSNHQALFVQGKAFKSEAKALADAAKEGWPVAAEFAEETTGQWGKLDPLTISHLSNSVSEASRTFAFYLPLRNESSSFVKDGKTRFVWRFRPGQRVRLLVPIEKLEDDVFVLPAAAVVREGPDAYVFRQNGDFFERRAVTVLHEARTEIVIKNDGSVGPGQYVARNQAAALNRAIKAAAGGGGGGHEGHDHAH